MSLDKSVFVLLNITFNLRDLLVKLLYLLLLSRFLILLQLFLVFFLFTEGLVFADVMLQVGLVVLELLRTVDEGLVAALLLFFQLLNLLIHSVISEFGQEHLFLLIDELVHILGTLLSWELHSAPCNVHGLMDMVLLLQVEVLFLWVVI